MSTLPSYSSANSSIIGVTRLKIRLVVDGFFDTGVGFNVGGLDGVFTCGAVGMMRIGHQFYESPITIALDWSPSIGFIHDWAYNISHSTNSTVFNVVGLANFGLNFSVSF